MSDSTSTASAAPPAARRNNPLRGIAFLCAGAFAFSVHDIGVKWVSGDYPLSEVLLIRSAIRSSKKSDHTPHANRQ